MAESYLPDTRNGGNSEEDDLFKRLDWRRYVLAVVRRWRILLLLFMLLAALGVGTGLFLRGQSYVATSVVLRIEPPKGVVIGEGSHFELPRMNIDTLVDTIKLPSNLESVREQLGEDIELESLAGRITLKRAMNSNLIAISGIGSDPKEAMDVANLAADVFVKYLLELRRAEAQKALDKLDYLVKDAEEKFAAASDEVTEFRKEHGIVLMDVETELSLEKVAEIKAQIEEAKIELGAVNRQINNLGQKSFGGAAGLDSAGLKRIESLRKELDQLRSRYTEENPRIQKKNEELQAMLKTVASDERGRSEVRRATIYGRINSLTGQKKELEERLKNFTDNEKAFSAIQQRYLFSKQALRDLMSRREEAAATARDTHGEFRIIERASPPTRPESSLAKLAAVAIPVGGTAFFIVLILLLEFFNSVLMSAKEVFGIFGLPVLGQHLHDADARDDIPLLEPDLYKPTVSSLLVENKLAGKKVVGFFSTTDGNGLTTVTENLANVMAARGKRVLYIGADLFPELPEDQITERRLAGEEAFEGPIDKTEEGLPDRFQARFKRPGDLDFLGSERLAKIFRQLKDRYDLILIDAPPAFDYVQVMELVPQLDAIVLVVRAGVTKKDHVERVLRQLGGLGTPILGAFITDAEPFMARHQERLTTSAYRKVALGRDAVENLILKKLIS